MTSSAGKPSSDIESFGVPELPERVLHTYARLWQLETWLRRLVYIELRAESGDTWDAVIKKAEWPTKNDKRLTHMPTAEANPLSYGQFSDICDVIEKKWHLFECFLPPKTLWEAKLEEVEQIRHRVAHFRIGHHDDLARVLQLLRDLDHGFWKLCTSYNDLIPVLPAENDPVTSHFVHLDVFPWTQVSDGSWARVGLADPSVRLGMTVEILRRPWTEWAIPAAGKAGLLYNFVIYARKSGQFDCSRFLEDTLSLHKHIVHVMLNSSASSVRLTIPACIGAETTISIVEKFYLSAANCLCANGMWRAEGDVKGLCEKWPEYVLSPESPLTFLDPSMKCSFFGV